MNQSPLISHLVNEVIDKFNTDDIIDQRINQVINQDSDIQTVAKDISSLQEQFNSKIALVLYKYIMTKCRPISFRDQYIYIDKSYLLMNQNRCICNISPSAYRRNCLYAGNGYFLFVGNQFKYYDIHGMVSILPPANITMYEQLCRFPNHLACYTDMIGLYNKS
jgi:hypothetical protein